MSIAASPIVDRICSFGVDYVLCGKNRCLTGYDKLLTVLYIL